MKLASDQDRIRRTLWTLCAAILFLTLSLRPGNAGSIGIGSAAHTGQELQSDSPLERYQNWLSKLDRSRVQSIPAARKQFIEEFSTANAEAQVDAFRKFLVFYRNVIRDNDAEFHGKKDLQKVLTAVTDETGSRSSPLSALAKSTKPGASRLKAAYQRELAELAEYRRCGIDFAESEGDWYLQEDLDFLLETAVPLKGEYHEYLAFYAREHRKRVVEDGGLMTSWGDLGRRISRWERFAAGHPSLAETRTTIEPELGRMMSWYLVGTDNSPAYDFSKKGAIVPELLRSYDTFLRDNKESRYFDLINKIRASLKTSRGSISKDVLALLTGAGYRTGHLERQAAKLLSGPR
ncbi:MAG: hypothetical protein ABFD89_25055 [Bryobacteraceae bacterium]